MAIVIYLRRVSLEVGLEDNKNLDECSTFDKLSNMDAKCDVDKGIVAEPYFSVNFDKDIEQVVLDFMPKLTLHQ